MFEPFYKEMKRFLPKSARIMACQFRGDPNDDIKGKWRARVLNRVSTLDEYANVYLCVSAMQKNDRGEWRRRKENFAGGLLLMIDDVGDGKGAKFPRSILKPLPPSAMVETSPGNFQATYFFDSLVTDMKEFDALIRAFIEKQFLGKDTGQAGVNRVFRPPIGINGKAKYQMGHKHWKVIMQQWEPNNRYSIAEIAKAFDLQLIRENRIIRDRGVMTAAKAPRIRAFMSTRASLRAAGMLKTEMPDYSGWIQCMCPWTNDHSDRADTGAAIRIPAEENEWFGGFRCHHGHCEGKGWRDLTDWLNEEQTEMLDLINANAPANLSGLKLERKEE